METFYDVPKWAGIPPAGFHLDVMKEGKLFQKLMIDEKRCYLFGRNVNLTDFCIDHASCSRVHAALVYHKHLDRFFLVDLGSTHGSHIGNVRLEAHKPTQLPVDSSFHFGASTRVYILREKPKSTKSSDTTENDCQNVLPESELEIDNLTEYNTAHNRRISMLGIPDTDFKPATAKKRKGVTFNEEEDIINPEDIDPSVGRFRNLVQTSIVPNSTGGNKRIRMESNSSENPFCSLFNKRLFPHVNSLSSSISSIVHPTSSDHLLGVGKLTTGFQLPNPAPEVSEKESFSSDTEDIEHHSFGEPSNQPSTSLYVPNDFLPNDEPMSLADKKKKYAKEAWPGRKNAQLANF